MNDAENEPSQADQARKLEMDEPMAGAGAQLSGENRKSETEENLVKDTRRR